MRLVLTIVGILLFLVVAMFVARRAWSVADDGPVGFRYVGVTNYKDRAYAILEISNRLNKDLRGYTYPIMASRDGWVAPRATASNMSYAGQRDFWVRGNYAAPSNATVVILLPPTTNIWRLVVSATGLGNPPPSLRQRALTYSMHHGYHQVARWLVKPSPKPGIWTLEQNGHSCVLGPEMRGTQLK